jgi:hypothetical protein
MNYADQRKHVMTFFGLAQKRFWSNGLVLVRLKGEDYSPEPIAMTEAFFAAADISVDVPQILWVHVRKHMSAIANYMHGTPLNSEDIRSRLLDVANYMALIDSYIANPTRWLRYLDLLIQGSEFPNRSEDEMFRLREWLTHQMKKHEALDEHGDNPLSTVLDKADFYVSDID